MLFFPDMFNKIDICVILGGTSKRLLPYLRFISWGQSQPSTNINTPKKTAFSCC